MVVAVPVLIQVQLVSPDITNLLVVHLFEREEILNEGRPARLLAQSAVKGPPTTR